MPTLSLPGATLHYEVTGSGPETIVFAHGLLWDGRLFAPQVQALSARYRCLTFDFRGQGRSEVTADGYDMDTLAGDCIAVIEALGAPPVHLVGLSMGGFVGLRVALRRPDLLRSLTLMDTSADPEPAENAPRYRLLGRIARWVGVGPIAGRVMPIMFGRDFLADPARAAERRALRARLAATDRVGVVRALGGVLTRAGVADAIGAITTPTLVMVGEQDVATVPEKARRIHARIPGSRLVTIPGAGHTATLEAPAAVTAALRDFLDRVPRG